MYIYVVEFDDLTTKFGISEDFSKRLCAYKSSYKHVKRYFCIDVDNARKIESELINMLSKNAINGKREHVDISYALLVSVIIEKIQIEKDTESRIITEEEAKNIAQKTIDMKRKIREEIEIRKKNSLLIDQFIEENIEDGTENKLHERMKYHHGKFIKKNKRLPNSRELMLMLGTKSFKNRTKELVETCSTIGLNILPRYATRELNKQKLYRKRNPHETHLQA